MSAKTKAQPEIYDLVSSVVFFSAATVTNIFKDWTSELSSPDRVCICRPILQLSDKNAGAVR